MEQAVYLSGLDNELQEEFGGKNGSMASQLAVGDYNNLLSEKYVSFDTGSVAKPYNITKDILDRALVARLSIDLEELSPNDASLSAFGRKEILLPHFEYLLQSWSRAQDIRRNLITRSKVGEVN
jgi:hypothetical protein